MLKHLFGACMGIAALLCVGVAKANAPKPLTYPIKPIEIFVSYAPGGGLDTTMRLFARHVEPIFGQRVVVTNKTGSGNIQGHIEAMNARPDGHVIGIWNNGLITDELLIRGIPYTWIDVQPLCMIATDPNVITINKTFSENKNIKTMRDLVEYVKANPGTVTIGIGGNWTPHDFLRMLLEESADLEFSRKPFVGGAPALRALAGGTCDVAVPFLSEVLGMRDSDKVVPLAVTFPNRVARLPDVPTTAEAGYPDTIMGMWRILSVPKNTPRPVADYIVSVFEQVIGNSQFQEEAKTAGINPVFMGTDELNEFLKKKYEYYSTKTDDWGVRVK